MKQETICKEQRSTEKRKRMDDSEKPHKRCPDCDSTKIITDTTRGDLICSDCGSVLLDKMVDMKHRYGGRRQSISAQSKSDFYRLRKWGLRCGRKYSQISTTTKLYRNLHKAMAFLQWVEQSLQLPRTVMETAAIIYRKAQSQNLIRGRSIEVMVLSSVYIASRIRRYPLTLQEISTHVNYTTKEIAGTVRLLIQELHIVLPPQDARVYIPKYCSQLHLSRQVSNSIVQKAGGLSKHSYIQGKNPIAIAATLIYIALSTTPHERSQVAISEVAGISEVTLRNHKKELIKILA